ncbi:MAG: hypothetical protein QMD80_06540, partial [archaeon]|nr:hypothetical protein [archaeon]
MLEEMWSDIYDGPPCEYNFKIYDLVYGWIGDDGVAEGWPGSDCFRELGGYHVRLWRLSTGDVIGQAHHDTMPPHKADQYEPIEELVAGYYKEPDDTQWAVYDDNYWLNNDDTPNGVYNDG